LFHHVEIGRYNWNYLDNLISGHYTEFEMRDWLKFWRARFVLIPNKTLQKGMKVIFFFLR